MNSKQQQTGSTEKQPPAVIYGTRVQFRDVGDHREQERDFEGDTHSDDAARFVSKHVCGIADEDFTRVVPKDQRQHFVQRRIGGTSTEESVIMWMRILPVWDWHVMTPISRPAVVS